MNSVLGLYKTPHVLEKYFKDGSKLSCELPTDTEMESIPPEELSSLAEEIHVKTREA